MIDTTLNITKNVDIRSIPSRFQKWMYDIL